MSGINKANNFNLIRILAATQVLVVHACNHFEFNNTFVKALKIFPGVPIFFFISGYLIGTTYIKNHSKGLMAFFFNRALRLYPALFVCVFFAVIVVYILGYYKQINFSISAFVTWILCQISFFQFYNPDFMRGYGIGVLNGSLWTISVELQFYILTPAIYYSLRNFFLKYIILSIFIVSLIINLYLRLYLDWSKLYMKLLSVSFLPWIYIFLLGFFFSYKKFWVYKVGKINIYLLLALYFVSMFTIGSYYSNAMNSINPISTFLCSLIVLNFSQKNLKLPIWLQSFIDHNDISYGVYIYHMPVINALLFLNIFTVAENIVYSILITTILAYISWKLIESPSLKFKK